MAKREISSNRRNHCEYDKLQTGWAVSNQNVPVKDICTGKQTWNSRLKKKTKTGTDGEVFLQEKYVY